jgi:hypothetical protein
MPTPRLVYLTEQQYAAMTDHARARAANNSTTTAEEQQLPSISNQEQTTRLVPSTDATRNASSSTKSDHEEDNDYLDILLQESIDAVNSRSCSFGGHAVRYHQQVQQEMALSSNEETNTGASRRVSAVAAATALTAAARPLDHSSATDETTMNVSNEDTNTGSSRRVSAVAAATMVHKRRTVRKTFDERFKDHMAFKAEFGHCNVPKTNSSNNKYSSLGKWCSNVRTSYKSIKKGGTTTRNYKLSKADMKRLENAGFEWNLNKTFDERFKDLKAFKAKFGHCNVPTTQSSNNKRYSLGVWCSHVRMSYKSIKEGGTPRNYKLSKADMKRLENAGFEWNICTRKTFDERFKDLMAFKAEFGHCNVPRTNSSTNKYLSLGNWCNHVRMSYKAIQVGRGMVICKISKADIKRLEKAGFEWRRLK